MKNDPTLYRKLNIPFASIEEANAATEGFADDLRAIREKWKIPDVYCVARIIATDEEGNEGDSFIRLHNGSTFYALPMVAYAYGLEQAEAESNIHRLVRSAVKTAVKKLKD